METIRVTGRDLQTLDRLRLKRRRDCLASFSVNEKREIWMYVTRGWTKEEKRSYVIGECPVVERIAEVFLCERPEGGRVFLTKAGLFYRASGRGDVLFAKVDFETQPITTLLDRLAARKNRR